MALQRMDNVGIVVDDLPATIAFFRELDLELEGQATIEREWAGRVTGRKRLDHGLGDARGVS
jgi:catechol 2,3-dioxygenase-like lactoylglutathione lyase family enzyme